MHLGNGAGAERRYALAALMAGRPPGSMNAEKIAFRDRFRAKKVELANNLIHLALLGKTEQIRLAATERSIDRGWGRPPQPQFSRTALISTDGG